MVEENAVLFNIEKRDTQMCVALLFYPYHSPKSKTQPSIFGKKSLQKLSHKMWQSASTHAEDSNAAREVCQRRTRRWQFPHARLTNPAGEIPQKSTPYLTEEHMESVFSLHCAVNSGLANRLQ
jgi:hypothetical protein